LKSSVEERVPNNLSVIVDRSGLRKQQFATGGGNEIEAIHLAVLPEKRTGSASNAVIGVAGDLASGIDRKGTAAAVSRQVSKVRNDAIFPQGREAYLVSRGAGGTNNLPRVVQGVGLCESSSQRA
jgi:hypothetical protein